MMLPVAILAGGLATRLRPITETIPKSLVPLAGRPFIHHQLVYLRAQGIKRVVLCVGYLGEMVRAEVGDGATWGIQVSYSFDGEVLLGTGGALRKALPGLGERFFVLYGDSYLPIEFAPVQGAFVASGRPALMTVLRNGNRWDSSNVVLSGDSVHEYNKRAPRPEMEFIDYGLGILNAAVLRAEPDDQAFDLADLYHNLSLQGQLAGFEVHQRFYEIGSHAGLRAAEDYFLHRG
jgi:NDP-sugar pyrophosphorylase family protein